MRPVFLLVYFMIGLVLAPLTFAWAQDVAPVVAPLEDDGGWGRWLPFVSLISESALAAILTLIGLVGTFLSPFLPGWLKALFSKMNTTEAKDWETYAAPALRRAMAYAATQMNLTPKDLKSWEEKEGFVAYALGCLRQFDGQIISFLDKDNNGVIDLLEGGAPRSGSARFLDVALMEAGAPAHVFAAPRNALSDLPQMPPPPSAPRKAKKPTQMELPEDIEAAVIASKLKPRRV